MTVFGARQGGSVGGGKPRHLGLALTLLLLLAMAVAAVWSMFSFTDGPEARFDQPDTEFATEAEPELAPPEPEPPAQEVAVAPEPELAPPEPDPPTPPEELAELTPDEPVADPVEDPAAEPEPDLPLVPELLDREPPKPAMPRRHLGACAGRGGRRPAGRPDQRYLYCLH